MAINQITTSNTFSQWLTATQSLIETANTLTDGKGATFTANTKLEVAGTGSLLNVRTSGAINQLYSNSATIANIVSSNIVTSTVNVSNTIVFSDNTILNSNVFIVRSFAQANAAFDVANTPSHVATSAAEYANAAFTAANTGSGVTAAGLYANNAFATANSAGVHANSAFVRANTPSHVANSASAYANGAFGSANTANSNATSAGLYANSTFVFANSSSVVANASILRANAAFIRANNSLDANSGGTVTGAVTISTGASGTSLSASANIVATYFVGTATASSDAFGVGQTWQVVTRSLSTWYQNTTGKAIGVYAYASISTSITWRIGPSTASYVDISMSDGDGGDSADYGWIVVPAGHYYMNIGDSWNNPRELR